MSGIRGLGLAMSLAGGVGLLAGAAQAQSFLDYLFGAPQVVQPPGEYAPSYRQWRRRDRGEFPVPGVRRRAVRDRSAAEGGHAAPSGSGYRTICVRTCDGYFWPISYSASSGQFKADERLCRASCPGQKVGLYVHRTDGQTADDAVSLASQPLAKLKNAFLYRQEYKPECKCQTPQTLVAARHDAERPDATRAGAGRRNATPIPAKAEAGPRGRSRPSDAEATGTTPKAEASRAREAEAGAAPEIAAKRPVRVVGPPFLAD